MRGISRFALDTVNRQVHVDSHISPLKEQRPFLPRGFLSQLLHINISNEQPGTTLRVSRRHAKNLLDRRRCGRNKHGAKSQKRPDKRAAAALVRDARWEAAKSEETTQAQLKSARQARLEAARQEANRQEQDTSLKPEASSDLRSHWRLWNGINLSPQYVIT